MMMMMETDTWEREAGKKISVKESYQQQTEIFLCFRNVSSFWRRREVGKENSFAATKAFEKKNVGLRQRKQASFFNYCWWKSGQRAQKCHKRGGGGGGKKQSTEKKPMSKTVLKLFHWQEVVVCSKKKTKLSQEKYRKSAQYPKLTVDEETRLFVR